MLVDLLSMDNYVNYNIQLAQILGLHPAIYISELLNINEKAVRKKKIIDDYFVVDRKYIEKRTTLDSIEQEKIDKFLIKLSILKQDTSNKNRLTLDLTILTSLVSATPATVRDLKSLVKSISPSKKKTKAACIADELKGKVLTQNVELRQSYYEWIDAVMHKQGWMSATSVTSGEKVIDDYCDHDLDLAIQLLRIASINGYRDIQWAINSYEKDYMLSYRPKSSPSKQPVLSSEVF